MVTQYGPSGGSFAYQGNSFRDAGAFGDADRDPRMCPFLCGEMKGGGHGGGRGVCLCVRVFGKGGK